MTDTTYQYGQLRQALIRAAREQLERDGAAALNLRALARGLGVTHPAAYRHFKDKNALLEAVAEEGFVELAERLRAGGAGQPGREAQLKRIATAYVEFAVEHPELTRVMFALIPAAVRMQNENLYAASKLAYAVLRENVPTTAGDETVSSAVVWAMFHGLAKLTIEQQLVILADPKQRGAVIDKAVRVLSKGMS